LWGVWKNVWYRYKESAVGQKKRRKRASMEKNKQEFWRKGDKSVKVVLFGTLNEKQPGVKTREKQPVQKEKDW